MKLIGSQPLPALSAHLHVRLELYRPASQNGDAPDIDAGNKSATFTFELENPDKSQAVTYIYPAAMANSEGTVNYDALTTQDGTLATLSSSLDLATYSAAWNGSSLPTGTLVNQLAVCALTLKNSDGSSTITGGLTKVTVSDGTNGYAVIPTSSTFGEAIIYVAIRPVTAALEYTATNGTNYYTKTATSRGYASGNFYNLGLRMAALPDGTLPGKFRVSSGGNQVYFSKGNLQYKASENKWQFAEHQYDRIGSDNSNISPSYTGWIDLFGWGTGSNPTQTSENNSDYSTFTDWGTNAITNGGNQASSGWRTMDKDEWGYLFSTRASDMSIISYVRCTVNGINGYIVLPDNWPQSNYGFTSYNNATLSYSTNQISLSDWTNRIEPYGALFLPVTGYREGTVVNSADTNGDYWSSSFIDDDYASHVMFNVKTGKSNNTWDRKTGMAVRLVKDVE